MPINLSQRLVCLPKFSIKGNYIKQLNNIYHILSCFVTGFLVGVQVFYVRNNLSGYGIYHTVLILNSILSTIGFISYFFMNLIQGTNFINLISKIQDTMRIFQYATNNSTITALENWVHVYIIIVVHFLIILGHFTFLRLMWDVSHFFLLISMMYFDIDMVNAIRMMKLLTIQLHMWFFEAETVCKMEINRNGSNGEWTNILEIYTNILDAFKIYGSVFQVQVQ